MNLKISKFLIILIALGLSDKVKTQNVKCDYQDNWFSTSGIKPTNVTYYECKLNTRQLDFGQEIVTIQGRHEIGNNDDDVDQLSISYGNKLKKFTSIFCQKFAYIKHINTEGADIELFDEDSLSNCRNLEILDMKSNKIRQISGNFLIKNSKLSQMRIQNNQLTTLPENLFINQKKLEKLHFQDNQMNFLPGNIFRPLVKLEWLYLFNNKFQSINPEWFVNLEILNELSLNGNQISDIPSKCFTSLRSLESLWLYDNRIKTLNSDSFDGLRNLKILDLQSNEISDLPVNIFTRLKNLQELYLHKNMLSTIHSDSFGVLNRLTIVIFENNLINAIDETLIDNTAVSTLSMRNNICSQLIAEIRSEIKPNLKKCFDNYQPRIQSPAQTQTPLSFLPTLQPIKQVIQCGKPKIGQGNIIGGSQVTRGDFSWNAALVRTNGQFFCGGTLISNRKVVTAAHCIQDKGTNKPTLIRDMIVLLGAYDLNNSYEAGRSSTSVQSINMHPDWNPNSEPFDADIAVLVLENQVLFSSTIQPICGIRNQNSNIARITRGFVVGYGRSEDKSKVHENIPKIIETPIHTNENCFLENHSLIKLSSSRTFCGGTGNGTGVCNGDSGSGLIVTDGNTFYLRGIVSSSLVGGPYGCNVDTYSVFTDVTKYVDWINGISTSRFN